MNDVETRGVVSIDPNDIFAQFGLETPNNNQNVRQRVGTIEVEHPIEEAEYEEVANLRITAITEPSEVPAIEAVGVEALTEVPRVNLGVETNNLSTIEEERIRIELSSENVPASTTPLEVIEENKNTLIPINPKSFEIDESTSRFSGATWFNAIQQSTVILAGLGGIGSYILFLLSRMKPKQIFIYDDDEVELANLSGQLYSKNMVGEKKVSAASRLAQDFSDYWGTMAIAERFERHTADSDIMICGFDSMEARSTFFNVWLTHVLSKPEEERKNCLFIDGRLAAEEFQVFCITGDNEYRINKYKFDYLFSDMQADATQCSYKQTSYCANMIGSIIVNLYTNFIANTLKPVIPRDLPFKTYYDASLMFFKTEV